MRRSLRTILTIAALLLSVRAGAVDPPKWMQFSVDWGYSQQFYSITHFNYITDEGYRIDEGERGLAFYPNARMGASVSFLISDRFTTGVAVSYLGCGEKERMYPIMLKAAWYPGTYFEDGFFLHADAGTFIPSSNYSRHASLLGELGPGYHVVLGGRFSVDFKADLRVSYTRPPIPRSDGTGYIEERNIRRNNAVYCALDFSIAVNF